MKIMKAMFVGIIIVIVLIVIGSFISETPEKKDKDDAFFITTTQKETKKADPELQRKRLKFFDKVALEGYFKKIEIENQVGKLWITNKFLLLTEKEKNTLLSVPYAYIVDELGSDPLSTPFVLKIDNGTLLGKRIGKYNPISGIKFYK